MLLRPVNQVSFAFETCKSGLFCSACYLIMPLLTTKQRLVLSIYHKTVVAVNAFSARVTQGVPINNTLSLYPASFDNETTRSPADVLEASSTKKPFGVDIVPNKALSLSLPLPLSLSLSLGGTAAVAGEEE